jgi:hypothetical protein
MSVDASPPLIPGRRGNLARRERLRHQIQVAQPTPPAKPQFALMSRFRRWSRIPISITQLPSSYRIVRTSGPASRCGILLTELPMPELNLTNEAEEMRASRGQHGLPGRFGSAGRSSPRGRTAVAPACKSSLTMRAQARGFSSRVTAIPDLYLIKQAEQGRETGAGQFGKGRTAISSAGRRPSKSAISTRVIAMRSLQSKIFCA